MPGNPSDWDEKHRLAAKAKAVEEPTAILCELWPLLREMTAAQGGSIKPHGGMALDLACGTGQNALFLAERGYHVTAVDWSGAALEILEERAREKGISVRRVQKVKELKRSRGAGIDLLQADLEKIRLAASCYQVIVCIRYLQRSLFPAMCAALRPGGMLLFETYTRVHMEFSGGPRDPRYLLNTSELRNAFPGLNVVFYRELRAGQGIASLLARKAGGRSHTRG